jgi:hypothetical protein
MATSPHQPESLSDEITRLKAELAELRNTRSQILILGQSSAGAGVSTNYPSLKDIDAMISQKQAEVKAKVDQLNGDTDNLQPGVNLLSHASEYT